MNSPATILITSSGTGSAVNAIRAMRLSSFPLQILASDVDSSAPGLFLADRQYVLPRYNAPDFAKKLFDIPKQLGLEIFCLPTFSEEISWFSKNAALLRENGVHTFLPSPESIAVCDNKWDFWNFARSLELNVPEVLYCRGLLEASIDQARYPVFAKQIVGSGSRFATILKSRGDLTFYAERQNDILVQDYVEGYEVTVDVFSSFDGEPMAASARKRISVKSGQSVKGVTISVEPFLSIISRVCTKLRLRGASNFQFIVSKTGPVLIEVNPRLAAGGLMLSVHAGVNIPLLYVGELLQRTAKVDTLKRGREGLCMTKFWNEVVYPIEQSL